MSTDIQARELTSIDDADDYRSLSSAAVASIVFGFLGAVAFLSWFLIFVPLVGLALGLLALRQIRQRNAELTGRGLAWVGAGMSAFCLLAGPAALAVVAAYEVPEGYQPLSYAQLQPEEGVPGQKIPPRARELEGKRVFIKGYIYPKPNSRGIKQFLLVRDQGDCCFGGDPKITDRIQVTLDDPLRLTVNTRLNRVGGIFHVEESSNAVDAGGAVYYHLKADYLQ